MTGDWGPRNARELESAARLLLDRARNHRLGVEFVLQGHPESVAALHGVHADVVHAARELLARQGRTVPPVPEEPPPRGRGKPPGSTLPPPV
ncbi:MAG: hypothetical protein D6718_03165 [Acidobacteria bacterium]|nr:MAG: hypothetical protein D6718_03165 [Acidobacteriota bacterium]